MATVGLLSNSAAGNLLGPRSSSTPTSPAAKREAAAEMTEGHRTKCTEQPLCTRHRIKRKETHHPPLNILEGKIDGSQVDRY